MFHVKQSAVAQPNVRDAHSPTYGGVPELPARDHAEDSKTALAAIDRLHALRIVKKFERLRVNRRPEMEPASGCAAAALKEHLCRQGG